MPEESPLRPYIKQTVNAINTLLAAFERGITNTSTSFDTHVSPIGSKINETYKQIPVLNKKYPYAIPLTTSIIASVPVTVRRGKLPGLMTALVAGGAATGALYGIDLIEGNEKL